MRTEKAITDLPTALVRISNLEAQRDNLRVQLAEAKTRASEAERKLAAAERDWRDWIMGAKL